MSSFEQTSIYALLIALGSGAKWFGDWLFRMRKQALDHEQLMEDVNLDEDRFHIETYRQLLKDLNDERHKMKEDARELREQAQEAEDTLRSLIEALKDENESLKDRIVELHATVEKLTVENHELRDRVEELERLHRNES